MNAAYAKKNDGEAARRKLVLATLQRSAGRSSEVAWITWDGLEWDRHFTCLKMEVPMLKTAKVNIIVVCAGKDRHSDWFASLGDFLTVSANRTMYDDSAATWLFPFLHGSSTPASIITSYVKALQVGEGGLARYQDVAVRDLPHRPTAGGFRPGAINELCARMPAEFAAQCTGHDLRKVSALFEYMDSSVALAMPGAIVLSGWPALPWGQLGMGPVPPSLRELSTSGLVSDMEHLELAIDHLYQMDSASPPQIRRDGHLRPMLHAAFASQVMYHDERTVAHEVHNVRARMRESLVACNICNSCAEAGSLLSNWSLHLKTAFETSNLHLTAPANNCASQAALQSIVTAINQFRQKVVTMPSMIINAERSTAMNIPRATATATVDDPTFQQSVLLNTDVASQSAIEHPVGGITTQRSDAPRLNAFQSLMAPSGDASHQIKLAGLGANEFFLGTMRKGGGVGAVQGERSDKKKAVTCFEFFNNIATPEERKQLLPQPPGAPAFDHGKQRALVAQLERWVIAYLVERFQEAGKDVPASLLKGSNVTLKVSSLQSRVDDLRKVGAWCPTDSDSLMKWRRSKGDEPPQPPEATRPTQKKRRHGTHRG